VSVEGGRVDVHAGAGKGSLALYAFVRAVVAGFCRLFWRLSIDGKEKVPDGPFVLAPVHRSNIDFAVVSAITSRRMRYMGKDSLWKIGAFGWFFSALGAFPVRRGSADREALRRCIEIIEGGEPLVMFPEGTRQEGPEVQQLFDGPAYVALRTKVPILPVGIGGSQKAMPRGSKMLHPVKVHLVIGDPLWPEPSDTGGRVPRRAIRDLTARLYKEVQALFDQAQERVGAPNR
jgi:1-acyl-sn-glycerol-3-phosphate acyltransferase